MTLVTDAERIAQELLAGSLPRRWRHVRAVARKANRIAARYDKGDRSVLAAAAWLHDVGYAEDVSATGLHALDGGRWLRDRGFDYRIAALVAHHSCASYEAEERGLHEELCREFTDELSPVRDALWYVDMTTGPDGQEMTVRDRLAEIRERYGPEHLVTRFWIRAESDLMDAVRRTEERLGGASN